VILLVTAVGVMGDGGGYDVHGRAAPRHLGMTANSSDTAALWMVTWVLRVASSRGKIFLT
jgi:hypothetical protein